MVVVRLPYVNAQKDRTGAIKYYYFRRNGIRRRLPGQPLSEEFLAAYNKLLKRRYRPGTWGSVVEDYLESASYKGCTESTKVLHRRILDELTDKHGRKQMNHLRRRHVRKMRDLLFDTPSGANDLLRVVKIICNFAVEEGIIDESPAADIEELKRGDDRRR